MAKILLIDDDPNGREILRFRLEKAGYEVREAPDGETGILLAQRLPDLIFLDVRIPKLDGWEVCRRLKTDTKTRNIPIIMLTGCSQPAQEMYGKQCGADDYLTKPWDPRLLLQITAKLLFDSKVGLNGHAEEILQRTRDFALQIIQLASRLPKTGPADILGRELVRCGANVGAAYREANEQRVAEPFVAKMQRVQKEMDQTLYWLGLLRDGHLSSDSAVGELLEEGKTLAGIFVSSVESVRTGV